MSQPILSLAASTPLAVGQFRSIHQHPTEPDRLIKVMRPDMVAARWGERSRWYKRIARARHYTGFLRELKEYVVLQARGAGPLPPIARVCGLQPTDQGLGLVVEKVFGPDRALAPNLASLIRGEGYSPWIATGVEGLFAELRRYRVIVGDVHPGNIVFGTDAHGGPRFVLIDGFGEKHFIPLSSMSDFAREWLLRRVERRLHRKIARLVEQRAAAGAGS